MSRDPFYGFTQFLAQHGFAATCVPAEGEQVLRFESELQVSLPQGFREYLLRFGGRQGNKTPVMGNYEILSLADIEVISLELSRLFAQEPVLAHVQENHIRPVMWDLLWLPFLENNGVDRYILDLHPGKNGQLGQIIRLYPGADLGGADVFVTNSFIDFINGLGEFIK